jgi:phosphatidylserine decarboxylase
MYSGPARPGDAPDQAAWLQITIFLSVLDVHINRTPVSGRVTRVEYQPGTFLPAYKPEASQNERSEIWFEHRGVAIVARQVVGILARRVVCRLSLTGVGAGDRLSHEVWLLLTCLLPGDAGQRGRRSAAVTRSSGWRCSAPV